MIIHGLFVMSAIELLIYISGVADFLLHWQAKSLNSQKQRIIFNSCSQYEFIFEPPESDHITISTLDYLKSFEWH